MTGVASGHEPLVSMQEVADYLGVSLQTFKDWRKHGRGPLGYRVGKYAKFRLSEVDEWLASRRERTG